jgi:hypothetical protein
VIQMLPLKGGNAWLSSVFCCKKWKLGGSVFLELSRALPLVELLDYWFWIAFKWRISVFQVLGMVSLLPPIELLPKISLVRSISSHVTASETARIAVSVESSHAVILIYLLLVTVISSIFVLPTSADSASASRDRYAARWLNNSASSFCMGRGCFTFRVDSRAF